MGLTNGLASVRRQLLVAGYFTIIKKPMVEPLWQPFHGFTPVTASGQ
jgi:hypothetical protein